MNFESVTQLEGHLKTFVQCMRMQGNLVHVSFDLKYLKMEIVTQPTSLALGYNSFRMKNFCSRLLNWIHVKAPVKAEGKDLLRHFQRSTNISKELLLFGTLMSFG